MVGHVVQPLGEGQGDTATGAARNAVHDIRHALNVIQLSGANLRRRLGPLLSAEDMAYLDAKLRRIETQIEKTTAAADVLAAAAAPGTGQD